MLESVNTNDKLVFADLSEEEKQKRGILGRLYGPCADIIHSTRNGRKYSDKLWEKVFQQPLVEEMFKVGGIPGEIDHPKDRSDTDSSRIAIMMPEKPKKGKDGKLMAYFDILDTPCGKIAYQLAKYGFKWGVSSRGEGDIIEGWNGEQNVDPNSYQLNAFDLVLIPSVEQARLNMITESLDKESQKALKTSISESLNNATPNDKKIMEETLKQLNIDYIDKTLNEEVNSRNTSVDNKVNSSNAADDIGADAIRSLQESLKQTKELRAQVKELQEKLSVCNAKEVKLAEALQKSNIRVQKLEKDLSSAQHEADSLQEQLAEKSRLIESKDKKLEQFSKLSKFQEAQQRSLNESLQQGKDESKQLNEQLIKERKEAERQLNALKENLEEVKKDNAIKSQNYDKKLSQASKLIEQYQQVADAAVNKYIESKAKLAGVKVTEVKRRLGENYSFNDIDNVCEELSNIQLDMGSLPFSAKNTKNSNVRVKLSESKSSVKPNSRYDDDIDDQLWYLANKH